MGKKKIKFSLSEEAEWADYFIQESAKAMELKARLNATDKEIDLMVYQLYEFTEEEIGMVVELLTDLIIDKNFWTVNFLLKYCHLLCNIQ